MNKRIALLLLVIATAWMRIGAAEWIDVTEDFVVNPTFVGDDVTTGWMGTTFGVAGPKENAEHFSKNYDTY